MRTTMVRGRFPGPAACAMAGALTLTACDHQPLGVANGTTSSGSGAPTGSSGSSGGGSGSTSSASGASSSSGGQPVACKWDAPFGEPEPVVIVGFTDVNACDGHPCGTFYARLAPSLHTIYFGAKPPMSPLSCLLYQASGDGVNFSGAGLVSGLGVAKDHLFAHPTVDGMTLYFASEQDTISGHWRIFSASHENPAAAFKGAAQLGGGVNGLDGDMTDNQGPFVTVDGSELWQTSNRSPGQGFDIYWSTLNANGTWAAATPAKNLNWASDETAPVLSDDKLTIYFASDFMQKGVPAIWRAHRPNAAATDFDGAAKVSIPLPKDTNSMGDVPNWLSSDGCQLYLHREINGVMRIYRASRQPT